MLPVHSTGTSAATAASMTAVRANRDLRFIGLSPGALLRFAAACERRLQRASRGRHGILRRVLRGKPGRDGVHVVVGETRGDLVHAVGRLGVTRARTPGADLRADVVRMQPDEAGNGRLHAGQLRTVAGRAGGHLARRVAPQDDRLAARERAVADRGFRGRRVGRPLLREVRGDLVQVIVGEIGDQIIHRRVLAATLAKIHQLVVEVLGRFAGETREVVVVGALTVRAVARRAALHARFDRVGGFGLRGLGGSGAEDSGRAEQQCSQERRGERNERSDETSWGHA
ncbi:hypothetical protein PT2222_270038 [Paraburkholderia tropica]